uniref:RNA polymerase sigma factor n=1 Tax=candidate division WOR-3 bacterium TaxID=2052148 RepID=A0A7C4U7E9_UNCW3
MEIDLKKLKKRDIKEFEKLFNIYINRVYSVVYRIIKDHHYSEDITMIVLNKVWENIIFFREESKLSTWIYRIAYNTALEFKRSEKIEFSDLNEDIKVEYNPVEKMDYEEKINIIKRELQKIPEKYSVAITLHYIDDMSYNDISEIMGIDISDVKNYIHRGKDMLKKAIERRKNGI